MFDSEDAGETKGSIKDRLRMQSIFNLIQKKYKMRLKLKNFNAKRIGQISYFSLFFYTPLKTSLPNNLQAKNISFYRINVSNYSLKPSSLKSITDLTVIPKRKAKKGIGLEDIKTEIKEKYAISEVSDALANDYLLLKCEPSQLFDIEIDDELKEDLISARVRAEKDLALINELAIYENHDLIMNRDINYTLKMDANSFEKLKNTLERDKKELNRLTRQIDEYTSYIERKYKVDSLDSILDSTIGLGLGLLTLPFSFFRSFTLGTNLIRRSLSSLQKRLKIHPEERIVKDYRITFKDIENMEASLNQASFLLDEILDNLDSLKYKIKLYAYKLPEVKKKLKQIEVLEAGLIKKQTDLKKMTQSFEKHKVKVIERERKSA